MPPATATPGNPPMSTDGPFDAVRLLDETLARALTLGASDIHFRVQGDGMAIELRVDGLLGHVAHLAGKQNAEQLVSRIKVLAQLNIGEQRIPQDGRMQLVRATGGHTDLRVSVMPAIHGENVVLRVLERRIGQAQAGAIANTDTSPMVELESLGLSAEVLTTLRQQARAPHGMLLITGPTGSGKTTTLYALIAETHRPSDRTITIEDPVEISLPGIVQIPVNEKKGLTFATGLRSILRHDPDRILVGEIRDHETAEIAIQAALTGHFVGTTVHANSVFDVISRFVNMRIDLYAFASALNAVVAQRLVRVFCADCVTPAPAGTVPPRLPNPQGCAQCSNTGYKGRVAFAEVLTIDDEFRDLILRRASFVQLKDAARQRGMTTLREMGLMLIEQGHTSQAEIDRVVLY